jgi:hypothetical protein
MESMHLVVDYTTAAMAMLLMVRVEAHSKLRTQTRLAPTCLAAAPVKRA